MAALGLILKYCESTDDPNERFQPPLQTIPRCTMNGIAESAAETLAIDEFNSIAASKVGQKDPYHLKIPQGLSKRDADALRRCRRRAHQLDHNAVLCYCCPCFFGLNTAICTCPWSLFFGGMRNGGWRSC